MRPPSPADSGRSLPPLAWAALIGAGLLLVVMVVLLSVQLAVLKDSRDHIVAQDAKISALTENARPALEQAEPAIRDVRPLIREARRALREIDGRDVAQAVDEVAPLLRTGRALAAAGVPLIRELEAAGIGGFIDRADSVVGTLLYQARLARVLDGTNSLLIQLADTRLIERLATSADQAPRAVKLAKRVLRVQKATLTVQRRTLEFQLTSLGIQRRTLAATESIDRKTGGRFPPTAAGP